MRQENLDSAMKSVAQFLEELEGTKNKIEPQIKEKNVSYKGLYQKEKVISVEPGVKYLITVEEESNWSKLLNYVKRFWWKIKN